MLRQGERAYGGATRISRGNSMPPLPYRTIQAIGAVVDIALYSAKSRSRRSILRIGFSYHAAIWSPFCKHSCAKASFWECADQRAATTLPKRRRPLLFMSVSCASQTQDVSSQRAHFENPDRSTAGAFTFGQVH